MNFNHRVADGKRVGGLELVLIRIRNPISIIIPILITLTSFWLVKNYFGTTWDIGTFSTRLYPLMTNGVEQLLRIDREMVSASGVILGFALTPLTGYLLAYYLTRRHLSAIFTGFLLLLPINIFSSQAPERLILALTEGDGAHIFAVSLVPIAAMLFISYLRHGQRKRLVLLLLTEMFISALSFFTQFILLFVFVLFTISEVLVSHGKIKLVRFGIVLGLYLILILVIYNISLLNMILSPAGRITLSVLFNTLPLTFFVVPIFGTFAFLIFDRRPALQSLFIGLTMSLCFGILQVVRLSFVSAPLLDQDRYAAEVSISFALLFGILATWLFDIVRAGTILKYKKALYAYRTYIAFGTIFFLFSLMLISLVFIPHQL